MSAPDNDYEVGYKRPPKWTRWRKGQSGNAGRKRKAASVDTVEIIDRMFAEQIDIVENGIPRKMTALEAIVLRIWAKEMSGSKRASAVRLKYQEFAQSRGESREIIIREVDED